MSRVTYALWFCHTVMSRHKGLEELQRLQVVHFQVYELLTDWQCCECISTYIAEC